MTSTPTSRGRRLSSGSMTSEAGLFPIYEDPDLDADNIPLFSDMESVAGSEAGWGGADDSYNAVTKEQLVQMVGKMRARYHKYKGRYTDIGKAYKELAAENKKVKEVMQQTQDKALRRISELKEAAALDKEAKTHLEEELRAELEEKQHVINSLNTKVALLKNQEPANLVDIEHREDLENGARVNGAFQNSDDKLNQLTDLQDDMSAKSSEESDKVFHLEDKVKRLESLLSKCKENIKANKNKLTALTEVKEQLATDLETKEKDLCEARESCQKAVDELQVLRKREETEEVQMAEIKLQMHSEMICKDEEIGKLRVSLNQEAEEKEKLSGEVDNLNKEIKEMAAAQESLEKRMEEERKAAMEVRKYCNY